MEINLISDTVTRPCKNMLDFMMSSNVGDDVFKEDPTVNELENMLAELKQIDLNGSFESDDEVGTVFTELKNTIETYKNKI